MARSHEKKSAQIQQLTERKVPLKVLYATKMDLLGWVGVLTLAAAFIVANVWFWFILKGKLDWNKYLEVNGTIFTIVGAIWTALGVQMTQAQYKAFLKLAGEKQPTEGIRGIVHSLYNGSRFATTGAWLIFIGGAALALRFVLF